MTIHARDKTCAHCGDRFNRRRVSPSRLEPMRQYVCRKYCSPQCFVLDKRIVGDGEPCLDCGRPCGRKRARGRCSSCYAHHRRNGTLIDIPRKNRRTVDIREDWELLRSEGYTRPLAAERMGISIGALDGALLSNQ